MVSSAHKRAACKAVAKHVSAEGCQFIVRPDNIEAGQRFRFNLEGLDPVIGSVRWVVGDRVGFAFDRPLSRGSQDVLTGYCRSVLGLDLFLA
ncbi:PilZ domain-containing protein [Novosphingobium album (ex Hu et al. 2023)]|uniref:PilZ domain-containing protein n=1 Tax=Novosphingobium album (ex Hu et al. 2023) TaxID=2930093 RepID=A0ABT0AWS0_9SPHN|nr:PilZ domain-containing protein [Novosphingobium album (ex Hu et al. 2023)]MCJ2177121.1 PilZ domain-containing protein [Novosphingobium album (ex Hu et al. 2023)]